MLCGGRESGSLDVSSLVLTGVAESRAGPSTLISSCLGAANSLSHSSTDGVSCPTSACASSDMDTRRLCSSAHLCRISSSRLSSGLWVGIAVGSKGRCNWASLAYIREGTTAAMPRSIANGERYYKQVVTGQIIKINKTRQGNGTQAERCTAQKFVRTTGSEGSVQCATVAGRVP